MTAKQLAMRAQTPLAASPLDHAIAQGASAEVISKLLDQKERFDAMEARKAFNVAIAEARSEIPIIFKSQEKTGAGGSYRYEDFASIARVIDPILSKHGLSYRFKSESNGEVKITCVISHVLGHSEENSLTSKPDTSGSKNPIQALGSAVTYLQRYTLKLALGIATSKDDDGSAAGGMSDEDAVEICQEMVNQITKVASLEELNAWRKGPSVANFVRLTAAQKEIVKDALNAKKEELEGAK